MRSKRFKMPHGFCYYAILQMLTLVAAANICQTPATTTCGACIRENPECAWCIDPLYTGSRCDLANTLKVKCSPNYLINPESNLTRKHDKRVGSVKADGYTIVQLEPQRVRINARQGDSVSFEVVYLHQAQIRKIYLRNSEIKSMGLTLQFEAICKGRSHPGNTCNNVRRGERVRYKVTVHVKKCAATDSNPEQVVSIGVGGILDVVAVYVDTICHCDCQKVEKQQKRSSQCSWNGTLVCGVCNCDPGRGGDRCQCDLSSAGVLSDKEMQDQCKMEPNQLPCSGKGACQCGQCSCDADYISGKFCECDDLSCPLSEGMMCSGKGDCVCGICNCEEGWTGDACQCSAKQDYCRTSDGVVCGNRGSCVCGKCQCLPEYEGRLCLRYKEKHRELSTTPENETEEKMTSPTTTDGAETFPDTKTDDSLVQPPQATSGSAIWLTISYAVYVLLLVRHFI